MDPHDAEPQTQHPCRNTRKHAVTFAQIVTALLLSLHSLELINLGKCQKTNTP